MLNIRYVVKLSCHDGAGEWVGRGFGTRSAKNIEEGVEEGTELGKGIEGGGGEGPSCSHG